MLPLVLLCLTLALSASSVSAWGAVGHNATAVIAQHLLNANATKLAQTLLGGSGSLEAICSWADEVRGPGSPYHFSTGWHTAYVTPYACAYNYERDCAKQGGCADSAIRNYTARLIDHEKKLPTLEHLVALKFLTHFVGDIHQPQHVGFRESGPSGYFLGQYGTLHDVWDTLLIEHRLKLNFGNKTKQWHEHLIKQVDELPVEQTSAWTTCNGDRPGPDDEFSPCVHEWISEGAVYACRAGYQDEKGAWIKADDKFQLGESYYQANILTVEYRLMQAGVRMAHTFNEIANAIVAQGGWASNDNKIISHRHRKN